MYFLIKIWNLEISSNLMLYCFCFVWAFTYLSIYFFHLTIKTDILKTEGFIVPLVHYFLGLSIQNLGAQVRFNKIPFLKDIPGSLNKVSLVRMENFSVSVCLLLDDSLDVCISHDGEHSKKYPSYRRTLILCWIVCFKRTQVWSPHPVKFFKNSAYK